MLEAKRAASMVKGQGRQGPAIQLRCDGGAGSQEHLAGPGLQRRQWQYRLFYGPEDQGQGPEFIGYILR